jgi:hypothetical protein
MTEQIHKRATIITIERPLIPPPPIDSTPDFCYINTLIFHDKTGKNIWEQKIPEAEIFWHKNNNGIEECSSYFYGIHVFKDSNFGWQLSMKISHDAAKEWLEKIMKSVEEYHENHFHKPEYYVPEAKKKC